jgi:hypothetical protein
MTALVAPILHCRQSSESAIVVYRICSGASPLRVFEHEGAFYGMARLGQLLRADDPLESFELGDSPFRDSPYAGRVRHVAMFENDGVLHVFFSAIGDAPEQILYTTIALSDDWRQWRIGATSAVITPQEPYECPDLPNEPSAVGEIDHPARQVRDPALFREDGKTYLFYTVCGEQGVAAAEVTLVP